jgi:hypothetical protein
MRKIILTLILILLLYSQQFEVEKGWKEIKVFQTNRTQIENILGKPEKEDYEVTYQTNDNWIKVIYSNEPCSDVKTKKGRNNFEKDTVIEYEVFFYKDIEISDLKFDKDKYERFQDPHLLNLIYYDNVIKGITITAFNTGEIERVSYITYLPTKEQGLQFHCKEL